MKTRMIRLLALLVFVTMLFTATGAGFAADETSTVNVKDGEHKVVDGNIITTAEYDPAARIVSYGKNKSSASLTVHGKIDSQYHGVEIYTEGGTITLVTDQDISALENGMSIAFSQAQKREDMTEETYNKIKDKATMEDDYGDYVYYRYDDTDNETVYEYSLYQGVFNWGIVIQTLHLPGELEAVVKGGITVTEKNDWATKGISIMDASDDADRLNVSVNGGIEETGTQSSVYGIEATIHADTLTLEIQNGGILVDSENSYATGIWLYAESDELDKEENSATIKVAKDVTTTSYYAANGFTGTMNNGVMIVDFGGSVTAVSQESYATGVSIGVYGSEDGETSTAIFATDGDITAAGEYATAFMGYSDYNSELTATVGGDVASKAQYEANGFGGESRNGSSLTAELGGKVSAESQNSEAKGVSLSAYGSEDGESSKATFATDGDITAVGGNGATAFRGYSDYGSELTATVGGDVTAEALKGRVNGIRIATKYADNKAEVEVTGDINAALTGDDFWYDTYGIYALNNGGDINVKTGGDVTSTGNGIYARNQRFSETKQLTPDDFEAMKDKFKLIWEDDGEKYYTYSDQETGAYYYYNAFDDGSGYGSGSIPKDYEATTTVTVDGAVTAAGKLNTWGINVESGNGNAMDITVGEDVTAESKENSATAIRATITGKDDRANAARITVGGEVAAKGQNGATGFTGYGSSGSSLTAELGGNVDAESQESFATGVSISAYASEDSDESKVVFTTGGDITATGKFSATGFSAESDYGSELTATVGGSVAAVSKERSATGIRASTSEEDSALKISVGGDLTAQALAATHMETEWVEDEDGEWHEEEYAEDNEAFGGKLVNYGGSINLDVAGNIETNRNSLIVRQGYTTETTDLDEEEAKAILSKATLDYSDTWTDDEGIEHTFEEYSYTDDSGNYYYFEVYDGEFDYGYKDQRVDVKAETNVTVGGNVIAENEDSYANGMILESNNKNGQTVITVGGAVQVSAQDSATGISGNAHEGILQASIAGDIIAKSVQSYACGLFASADGKDAYVAFTAGGMVSATAEKGGNEFVFDRAVGVDAQVADQGGTVDIEVLGGVSAAFEEIPETATGINVRNRPIEDNEGVIAILVTGDVESTGNGVNVVSASETNKGAFVASKEKTDIEIIGDVTAGERGLNLEQAFNTDVIVDGTVSGGKGAVVLRDDTDASSLMLTVWELVPDENGAVITRYDHTATDEDVEYIEDRELEKEVQYIIHVIQPEKGATLYTEGTEEYEGYLVAHEGDTVYLIADMKPGYRITGAFYDEELTRPMTKEKYNRYFVAVPKGGAVSLSALIERALKLASLKPDYTVTYSEPNDYDEFVEKDRNGSKAERTQIRMNGNGGTVYGQENYFALARNGSTLTLPQPDAREGFTFIGWYPNALANGAAAPREEELIGANTQVTAGEASIYTAIWKETK